MKQLAIALDASTSMSELMPYDSQTRQEWAMELIRNTIKTLHDEDLEISLFLLKGDDIPPLQVGTFDKPDLVLNRLSSYAVTLHTGIISLWKNLKEIIEKIQGNIPWSMLCITDGDDIQYDNQADEFYRYVEQYVNASVSIVDILGCLNQVIRKKRLPDYIQHFEPKDKTNIINSAKNLVSKLPNAPYIRIPEPIKMSTAILPMVYINSDEYDIVVNCLHQVIPYIEKVTGLRYYPAKTWLVNKGQMGNLYPPHEAPVKIDRSIFEKKFWALYSIILSFSLNFHIQQEDGRLNDYTMYTSSPELSWKIRGLAECMLVVGKYVEGTDDGQFDKTFRVDGFSDSLDPIDNLKTCLCEIVKIWKKIAKEMKDDSIYFCHQYFPDSWRQEHAELLYKESLPQEIKRLVDILLVNEHWNGSFSKMCDLFDMAITEFISLLYRLKRVSTNGDGMEMAVLRAAGLYIPMQNSFSMFKLVGSAIMWNGYPRYFQPGFGGNVVIDIESLNPTVEDKSMYIKNLTSLIIHEHAHAIFAEGIGLRNEAGQIDNTDDADTVNESLAEWMELNYWRNDVTMTQRIWDHAYSSDLPMWKYAGVVYIENLFRKKGIRGIQSLITSLRKGSKDIYKEFLTGAATSSKSSTKQNKGIATAVHRDGKYMAAKLYKICKELLANDAYVGIRGGEKSLLKMSNDVIKNKKWQIKTTSKAPSSEWLSAQQFAQIIKEKDVFPEQEII